MPLQHIGQAASLAKCVTSPWKSYSLIWSKNVKWEGIGFRKAKLWAYLGKHIKKKRKKKELYLPVEAYVLVIHLFIFFLKFQLCSKAHVCELKEKWYMSLHVWIILMYTNLETSTWKPMLKEMRDWISLSYS